MVNKMAENTFPPAPIYYNGRVASYSVARHQGCCHVFAVEYVKLVIPIVLPELRLLKGELL